MTKSHTLSGIRWTLTTSILRRIITLVLFYFIARWLSKEELGVFREYSLILSLLAVVGTLSLDYHYIIDRRHQNSSLAALWQVSIITAAGGFVLLTLGSTFLGALYHDHLLGRLFLYTAIFLALEIVRKALRAMASRNMQFRELALAETYNVVFYSIIAIAILFAVRSVWVYVITFYLGNLLETAYLAHLNRDELKSALRAACRRKGLLGLTLKTYRGFLTQATLVSIVNIFSGNAPILILGMLLSPDLLGVFFFASQLIGVPVGMFSGAVNQVLFPVFANKQDPDIRYASARYLRLTGNIGLPLLLLFTFIMMYLVEWMFGTKWNDAIPLIPAMFVIYGTSLFVNPIGGIPFIKRKPGWELGWNIVSFIVRVLAMLIGLKTSFLAAIWSYALAAAVTNLAFYVMAMYLVKAKPAEAVLRLIASLIPIVIYAVIIVLLFSLTAWLAISGAVLTCLLMLIIIDVIGKGVIRADIKLLTTGN